MVDEPIDILKDDEPAEVDPPVEPTKEEPTAEPTQEALDWRDAIENEDLKKSSSLEKFKTVDDLVESYNNLEHRLGTGNITQVNDDSSFEDILKFSEKTYNLKEEKYKDKGLTEQEAKFAWDNRIPPTQAVAFLNDFKNTEKEKLDLAHSKKVEDYKDQLKLIHKDDTKLNIRLQAGLNALKLNFSQYKKIMGTEALNPEMIKALTHLGKEQYSEEELKIKEGAPAGLPSNPDVLKSRIQNLAAARVNSQPGSRERMQIEEELRLVKAKFTESVSANKNNNNKIV